MNIHDAATHEPVTAHANGQYTAPIGKPIIRLAEI
jgi:hypothetical protein